MKDRALQEQWLEQIAQGNTDALNALYQETKGAVYGYALSILKNGHDAEEWALIPELPADTSAEARMLLEACLKQLAEEEREIVLLHAVSGFKYREIAAFLSIPLPTVLSKYHRAIKKMQAYTRKESES